MTEASVQAGPDIHGLTSFVIENNLLRVTVLPQAGAKVWQIHYKPLQVDLLWNNPSIAPSAQTLHASYDDTWSGGWDELFPNDEACRLMSYSLPDHGELWTGAWKAETIQHPSGACLRLCFKTPVSNFYVEKTLLLRPNRSVLEVSYELRNEGIERFPFLFKLHPAFVVSEEHRVDFPPMLVRREPEFPGTLADAPIAFAWPYVPMGDNELNLREVPGEKSGALHFFYGTDLNEGWCGVTDKRRRLAAAIRFDPHVFSSCWLFATHGGWNGLNVAVLEPATGFPFKMQSMLDTGRARWLGPGESLKTSVLFSVQEGLGSIGGVDIRGLIAPSNEG